MKSHAMKRFLVALLFLLPGFALAAGGAAKLDYAPINPSDATSLQSGARTFVNYCLSCHGAQHLRYNQLEKIGLSKKQIEENLLFTAEKVGGLMVSSMSQADGRAWFGAAPPDLSVIARVRGTDWLYTYLRGFYRDPETATGWNNTVFPAVAMPHVLWELQGARNGKWETEKDGHGHEHKVLKLDAPSGGKLSTLDYDKTIADLVNFLAWAAEPSALDRKRLGYYVLMVLGVLMLITYLLKAAFWKDVH